MSQEAVPQEPAPQPVSRETTVAGALRDARGRLRTAGFEDDGVEAEAIVCHGLGVESSWLYAHTDERLSPQSARKVEEYLRRRLNHEPQAYITGVAHFYGREFAVDRRVLIPRPETEILVERVLAGFGQEGRPTDGPVRIADIGTGSGILAVTLALELPRLTRRSQEQVEVHAVDSAADALEVARSNAARHGVESRVRFYEGDLAGPLEGRFDIVVANLPYIRSDELSQRQPELSFEPRSALDGGEDGMKYIGPLIDDLPRLLAEHGVSLLEIDPPIAAAAVKLARSKVPGARVSVVDDLAGLDRVLEIERALGKRERQAELP